MTEVATEKHLRTSGRQPFEVGSNHQLGLEPVLSDTTASTSQGAIHLDAWAAEWKFNGQSAFPFDLGHMSANRLLLCEGLLVFHNTMFPCIAFNNENAMNWIEEGIVATNHKQHSAMTISPSPHC